MNEIPLKSQIPRNPYPKNITYEISKRAFDFTAALIGLILLFPLLVVVTLIIRLTSPGPVFYRGIRCGRDGIPFRIFKFRSMVIDAEKGAGSTGANDPRITGIGRVIRKYKIDELPQLLNVLSGEMSFVGPRPELLRYTSQYIGEELIILSVRPGITDYSSIHFIQLGEVLGNGDPDLAYEENVLSIKNKLRIRYVKERNFWLDLKLIFSTIFRLGNTDGLFTVN